MTGTRLWLSALADEMGLKEKDGQGFRPWTTPQGQVGGYTYTLVAPGGGELIFSSIRNAGHLVPTVQASRSLQLFTSLLGGNTPDGLPLGTA